MCRCAYVGLRGGIFSFFVAQQANRRDLTGFAFDQTAFHLGCDGFGHLAALFSVHLKVGTPNAWVQPS